LPVCFFPKVATFPSLFIPSPARCYLGTALTHSSRIQSSHVSLLRARTNATAQAEEFIERREDYFLLLGLSRSGFQSSSVGRNFVESIAASRSLDLVDSPRQLIPIPALGLGFHGADPIGQLLLPIISSGVYPYIFSVAALVKTTMPSRLISPIVNGTVSMIVRYRRSLASNVATRCRNSSFSATSCPFVLPWSFMTHLIVRSGI
jgi:hypothetical protein